MSIVMLKSGGLRAALLASIWLSPGATALAQTAVVPTEDGIADIIVTAQKRSEKISDVAMSITAVTQEALIRQGVLSVRDLGKVTPGLTYSESSFGTPVYTLRGLGYYEGSLAASPAVSVYVDEIPIPYSAMTRGVGLDVARVEILKGPQGTLFGQNSTGGAINYIAARPGDRFEAGADVSYGRFNAADLRGFISGPISSTLSARLSARHEQSGDWQCSYTRKDSHGRINRDYANLLLDWTPTDRIAIKLSVNGWTDDSDSQAGQLIRISPQIAPALDPRIAAYPLAPRSAHAADWGPGKPRRKEDFIQTALRMDYEFGPVDLTSLTSYADYDVDGLIDLDGTALEVLHYTKDGSIQSFSQELRLSSRTGSAIQWMVGGNYQKNDVSDLLTLLASGGSTATSFPGLLLAKADFRSRQKVETLAGFASVTAPVTDHITVEGGLRYNQETRRFVGCGADAGDGQYAALFSFLSSSITQTPVSVAPGACLTLDAVTALPGPVTARLKEDNLSWRANVKWRPSNAIMLYANISRGYKSGGFPTLAAALESQFKPALQESVLAYEVGFKGGSRKLQLTGAAFYYAYTDKQIKGNIADPIFNSLEQLINIPKSRVMGAELQADWSPIRGLKVNGGLTYVNSRIRGRFVNFDPFGQSRNFGGQSFPFTPKWQGVLDAEYEQPVGTDLSAFVGGHLTYQSRSNAALGQDPIFDIDAFTVLDLRVGIASEKGKWKASLWGRNITNSYYWSNSMRNGDTIIRYAQMPVTYGISVSWRY